MNIFDKVKPFLTEFQKPGRYVGNDINSIIKDNYKMRFVICYPDLYELGMSNNGLQILYNQLNKMEDVWCERVFAVAPDFFDFLKIKDLPLYSLESGLAIKNADIIGFNVAYEMLFTNILQVLDLGKIPFLANDRNDSDPIIIGGGGAATNPGPIAEFFDLIFLGDGEEAVVEISEKYLELKAQNISRKEIISQLSTIQGVFNANNFKKNENTKDKIIYYEGKPVEKRVFRQNLPIVPETPVVPSLRTSQERAVIEVMKGCYNLCKFCHAGYFNLPCRFYSAEDSFEKAKTVLTNTGQDGISFSSLSISDYKYIIDLLNNAVPWLNERGLSISLPSMKVDRATLPIIKIISNIRKASITFAVESASIEIRKLIHKRVDLDELLEIIEDVFNNGWKTIKLYFMLGLPGYKDHDEITPAIDLLKKINSLGKGRKKINATFSPFVPKPHTAFELEEMASKQYFFDAVTKLKQSLPRNISIKNHNVLISELEGVLSRGDPSLTMPILEAYKNGAYLDSWDEYFKIEIWNNVFEKYNIDKAKYLSKRTTKNQPWKIIDANNDQIIENRKKKILSEEELLSNRANYKNDLDYEKIEKSKVNFESSKSDPKIRLRMKFLKIDKMVFYSHLDIMEVFKRAFRRNNLPLAFSSGFNKRELLHSGYPLPLGIESDCEYVDIDLCSESYDIDMNDLNKCLPDGLEIVEILENIRKLKTEITVFEFKVSSNEYNFDDVDFETLLNTTIEKKTKKGMKSVLISDSVYSYKKSKFELHMKLTVGTSNSIRIDHILKNIFSDDYKNFKIKKINHFLLENEKLENFF